MASEKHQKKSYTMEAFQNISESMYVIPLIKAVQELSAQNEDLKSRIEVLENS